MPRYWPILLTALALLFCLLTRADVITLVTVLSGVLCVSLIAIGRRGGHLVGLVSSISYAWIAWQNGLYGEVGLNLLFYLPTAGVAYFAWGRHQENGTVEMLRLAARQQILLVCTAVAATAVLGWALSLLPGQNDPFVDAATNVLSIVATLLMIWRYAEQWWLYFALNLLTVALWVLRYWAAGYAADGMIFLWLLYLVNSGVGFYLWSRKGALPQVQSGNL